MGESPRPLLLDLFAGQGGASVGYAQAGFEVIGVDIEAQPRYPFDFYQADALEFLREEVIGAGIVNPTIIHASPPCQAYSVATRDKSKHPDLIGPVRDLLNQSGLPYVIENVVGSPLRGIILCGSSFGLRVRRHRVFESNVPLMCPPCAHEWQGQPVGVYGGGTGKGQKRGRKVMSSDEAMEVMEMPWADRKGATQAVPPAYTTFVGEQLIQHLNRKAVV